MPRTLLALLVVALVLTATVVSTLVVADHERDAARDHAATSAMEASDGLRLVLEGAGGRLADTGAFMEASDQVTGAQFDTFARTVLAGSGLEAIQWLQVVLASERPAFEARTGHPITQLAGVPGRRPPLERAGDRPVYFPARYLAAKVPGSGRLLGFDVGRVAERRRALDRAAATGRIAATPPLALAGTARSGIVLYHFVPRPEGFVGGSIDAAALLAPVRAIGRAEGLRTGVAVAGVPLGEEVPGDTVERRLDLFGEEFAVQVGVPRAGLLAPALVALGGLITAALLIGILVSLTRRDRRLAATVEEATADLAAREREQATLLANLPHVVWRFDRDRRCTFVSAAVRDDHGLDVEQARGRTIAEIEPDPECAAVWDAAIGRVLALGEPEELVLEQRLEGRTRFRRTRAVPELDGSGEVQSVLVVTHDETRRRRAELALIESEERFRALVTSLDVGVIVRDAGGRIVTLNPAAAAVLGVSEEELRAHGMDDNPWTFLHPDGSPWPRPSLPTSETLRTGRSFHDVTIGFSPRPDVLRWLSLSTTTAMLDGARVVLTSYVDITDRVEVQRSDRAVHRISVLVAAEAGSRRIFDQISLEALELVRADAAAVVRFDPDQGQLVGHASHTGVARVGLRSVVDLGNGGPVSEVARTGRPARHAPGAEGVAATAVTREAPARESVAVPIVVEGKPWGALIALSVGGHRLAPDALARLTRLAEVASLAVSAADARAQLTRLATSDHLTGLLNRRAFEDRIEAEVRRARRYGRNLSLAILDIDHFKLVNDTFGHQEGDRVLLEVTRRLKASVRAGEVVARVGGEEFAWILPETDSTDALAAAERVRETIARGAYAGGGSLTVSIGVCDLAEAADAADLFRLADVALYWAKSQGRDRVFRYSHETLELLPPGEGESRLERARTLSGLQALARAIDAKDPSTRRHSERVAALARRLALAAGWDEERAGLLHEAALVHDVGKIAVPDAILLKAGPLTEAEYALVKDHPRLGAAMLQEILTPEQITWVRGHHERPDGRGYPDGLDADRIPEGAALLALADAWDAMTASRVYAAPMSADAARAQVEAGVGTQFTRAAVDALQVLGDPVTGATRTSPA